MRRVKYIILFLMLLVMPFVTKAEAKKINVYMFRGEGCPHCEEALEFFDELKEDEEFGKLYKLVTYEVWYNETNSDYQDRVAAYFQINSTGVPFYIIGDKTFLGYAARFNDEIKATIDEAYNTQAKDIVSTIK